MHTATVSVIMAAYNHSRYIDKAIASVLAQTWQDFELIVIDDGSTDATGQVVGQFGARVRYIRQENHGQGNARNRGIASTSGEYICFLDDDDLWEPEYLTTAMSAFRMHPSAAALYTGYRIIDSGGQVLPEIGNRMVPPDQMYDALKLGGWFPPLVVTVRKACLDRVGPLDEDLRGHDDWDLWLRIARSHTFRGISDVLARYRVHPGGFSANTERMLHDRIRTITKHFGPDDGPPTAWSSDRRLAMAAAYHAAALACWQSGDLYQSRLFFARALDTSPDLLRHLDTFYELVCGGQPRGYRGITNVLDIEVTGAEMLQRMDDWFAGALPTAQNLRGVAYGNAYLALAMLNDQAGNWAKARRYLFRAVGANPRLLGSGSVVRRFVKLSAGQRLLQRVKALRREVYRTL